MSGISAERLATFTYEELVRRAGNRVYPTTSHRQSECWTDEGRGSPVRTYTYSGSDSEEGDDGQEPALRLDLSEEELELASPSPPTEASTQRGGGAGREPLGYSTPVGFAEGAASFGGARWLTAPPPFSSA